jgi:SAM-dependent methyltransferase
MRDEAYRAISELEDIFWWHRARRRMVLDLLRRHGVRHGGTSIDLGCGAGGNLAMFDAFDPRIVLGLELSPIGLELARQRDERHHLIRADISKPLPFQPGQADLVTVFGVLNHSWISDKPATFTRIGELLAPGGRLIITEPAFPCLSRRMDVEGMTNQRFRTGDIAEMAAHAGLDQLYLGYFVAMGFLPALLLKWLEGITGDRQSGLPADLSMPNKIVNAGLYRLALLENSLIARGLRLPFGVGLIGVFGRSDRG